MTRLLAATRVDGPGVDRLVQHSAGSGKSNTIAWAAHLTPPTTLNQDLPGKTFIVTNDAAPTVKQHDA